MKLTPTAAAAAEVAADAATEAMYRQVAEKIPLKEAMRELTRRLTADLDAALQEAIESRIGPIGDPEALRGRLQHSDTEEWSTYFLDGVAVLRAGPVALERVGDSMRGSRTLEKL
jgi:hypothetical protein